MYIHTGIPKTTLGDEFDWGAVEAGIDTEMNEIQGSYPVVFDAGSVFPNGGIPQTQDSGSSWWNSITGALVPISQAAANIIRATSGQQSLVTGAVPAGYTRNAAGQLVPIPGYSASSLSGYLPMIALGAGAFLLLRKK